VILSNSAVHILPNY